MTMIDMMEILLKAPAMYLGIPEISRLENFWHGWTMGRGRKDENLFMMNFYAWARKKLKIVMPDNQGWAFMFKQLALQEQEVGGHSEKPAEEAAIDIMRVCWTDYLQETPKEDYPYEPLPNLKPYRSIDDP
jgi:hypothetical protein